MDKLTLSKDSWHYWFISKTTTVFDYSWKTPKDICAYTRAFIAGALKTLFLGTVALSILAVALSAVVWWVSLVFKFKLWAWVVGFGHLGTLILGMAILMVTVFALVTGVSYLKMKYRERRANAPAREPSAAAEMYSSWKNKTCKQIEFN